MKTAGLLLGAGRSQRFGPEDKLLASFKGKPLLRHAADVVQDCGFSACIATVSSDAVAKNLAGFEICRCSGSQADSLKTGIRFAASLDIDRVVVLLADMPFVTTATIQNLMSSDAAVAACSIDGMRAQVPIAVSADLFPELLKLEGDQGARDLLRNLQDLEILRCPKAELWDIDTPEELDALSR